MPKYRTKPVIREAWYWADDGTVPKELSDLIKVDEFDRYYIESYDHKIFIDLGDYIIRDQNGYYYPCKPDIFEKTYELVEE